jgi:RNase P subunit RPR2
MVSEKEKFSLHINTADGDHVLVVCLECADTMQKMVSGKDL